MAIQPIFIFSVSRSGSTLLQRVIAAHEGVATAAEPWLLLPYAYTFRRGGVDAEYLHRVMVDAIEDFCEQLPGGQDDYRDELRNCVLRLYEKAAGEDTRFFVDKSPPYCLIAQEIMELFPEGKFVFLWRNPLGIIASTIKTWEPWRPTLSSEDLFTGLPRLVSAYEANRARCYSVRFEDLIDGDERRWRPLTEYLGIEFEPDALRRFAEVDLNGRMGDKVGVERYATLSREPREKWRSTLANPLRKAWCRRYLRFLGSERLATMGYDAAQLIAELDSQPATMDNLIPDIGRLIKDVAKEPIRIHTRSLRIGRPHVIRELMQVQPRRIG
jgi:Sulfotransferase family